MHRATHDSCTRSPRTTFSIGDETGSAWQDARDKGASERMIVAIAKLVVARDPTMLATAVFADINWFSVLLWIFPVDIHVTACRGTSDDGQAVAVYRARVPITHSLRGPRMCNRQHNETTMTIGIRKTRAREHLVQPGRKDTCCTARCVAVSGLCDSLSSVRICLSPSSCGCHAIFIVFFNSTTVTRSLPSLTSQINGSSPRFCLPPSVVDQSPPSSSNEPGPWSCEQCHASGPRLGSLLFIKHRVPLSVRTVRETGLSRPSEKFEKTGSRSGSRN